MNMRNMLGANEKEKETKENEDWQAAFVIMVRMQRTAALMALRWDNLQHQQKDQDVE